MDCRVAVGESVSVCCAEVLQAATAAIAEQRIIFPTSLLKIPEYPPACWWDEWEEEGQGFDMIEA